MAVAARRLDSAAAVPAPARAPARRSPASRPAPAAGARRRVRPRLGRSVVWIAIVAALLAGIVALNVAVLQLRIDRGRISSEIAEIRAENAGLHAELSKAKAGGRVESLARSGLGLVDATNTTYLKLRPDRR
jgi:cell division protein FtsB